jgi:hypothetical protein
MIYKYTSVKEIIGRVVRDVGNKLPSHYFDSMLEWIPEGIRQLETKYQIIKKSTGNFRDPIEDQPQDPEAIYTRNHVALLPKDLIVLEAVEDLFGSRVRYASDITDFKNQTNRFSQGRNILFEDARPTNFQVDVFDHFGFDTSVPPPGQTVPFDGTDLKRTQDDSQLRWTYKISGPYIQTSEECMFVKLHYLGLQLDEDGYLMVPDVEEYKSALSFYVLRQLVGAGFAHPIWNGPPGWNHFNSQWEKMAGRALGIIKYPTQDRMEALRSGFAERLVPPHYAYDDFFIGLEQTQNVYNV